METKEKLKKHPLERLLDSTAKIEDYFSKSTDVTIIFFADLANSTLYKQKRPFVFGLNKTRIHNSIITDVITQYGGMVVKYIGDAVLARFDINEYFTEPHLAINAAISIQEKFSDYNLKISDPLEKIESKIGIAAGVVADFYGNDPQGKVVDLAARIEAYSKPNQILVHKDFLDSIDIGKIQSRYGIACGWSGIDHIGKSKKIMLKGIPEPKDVLEIRWKENFLGIKEELDYYEYWENYRYEATFFPLDSSYPSELRSKFFNIIFDLRYTAVLKKSELIFTCVNSIEDLNLAMKDPSLFSRYMLPKNDLFQQCIEKIFRVQFVRINDKELFQKSWNINDGSNYIKSAWTSNDISELIGHEVNFHYRVSTIIAKRGNFFAMLTEYPVKNLSMNIDMGAVPIRKISPIDFFASKEKPQFIYTPDKNKAKKIEVIITDWIYPRGGVVFVWDLCDEEKLSTRAD